MSENPILGYRTLSDDETALVNEIKAHAEQTKVLIERVMATANLPADSARWASIARTHLQQGFMALVRAVTRPSTF